MSAGKKVVWTAAYLRRDDGTVLVRRRGQGVIDAGMYGPPGGKLEVGETIEECLYRELEEETGLLGADAKLVQIYDTTRGVCFFYRVHWWEGDLTSEHGHGSWFWLRPEQIKDEPTQGGLAAWLGRETPGCVALLGNHDMELYQIIEEARARMQARIDGPEIRQLLDLWSALAQFSQALGLDALGQTAETVATDLLRAIHPPNDKDAL